MEKKRKISKIFQKIMYLSIQQIILAIVFMSMSFANGIAQSVLEKEISLQLEDREFKSVLKSIEKNADIRFTYTKNLIQLDKKVSVNLRKEKLSTILESLFVPMGISYEVAGNYIILNRKSVDLKSINHKNADFRLEPPAIIAITGKVVDDKGEGVMGVNIQIKGTTKGANTDQNGYYSISVPDEKAVLVFSSIGFVTQETTVGRRSTINIVLETDVKTLNEVVVVGYGSVKKSDLTGSVVSLKSKELTAGLNQNFQQSLIGRAAGVQVYQKSGEPGSAMSVKIRGASSITAGNDPLYVIDGMPINDGSPVTGTGDSFVSNPNPRNPLNSLNPNDIESIEILKDASATAIYGARGSNGVVLITTKKGNEGGLRVNYSGSYGVQTVANSPKMLTGEQYRDVLNGIIDAGGGNANERITGSVTNTDWQSMLFQQATVQNYDLSFQGGNNNTKYYVSLGYMDQAGVVKNSGSTRYSARFNLENRIKDKYTFGINLNTSYIKDLYNSVGIGVNENASALYAAIFYDPTIAPYKEDGSYNRSIYMTMDHPVALINGQIANSDSYRTFGTMFAEYFFMPALSAKVKIGGDINTSQRNVWIAPMTLNGVQNNGIASILTGTRSYYMGEFTMNYTKQIAKHFISAVAGATNEHFGSNSFSGTGKGYTLPDLKYDAIGSGTQSLNTIGSGRAETQLISFLGRVNYSFNDKYLITASIRADGSSRFGPNNRYGFFPSAAFAWKAHEEAFMKDISAISELKLRASYGVIGNQSIGNFLFLPTFGIGGDAIFGGVRNTTIQPSRNPNPDLKWESAKQMDIGVDFGLFKNKIKGTIEYYNRTTSDLLLSVPQPLSSGFGSRTENVGSMRNTGIELTLGGDIIKTGGFTWNLNGNFSTLSNEVISLGSSPQIIYGAAGFISNAAIIQVGKPLASYYGFIVDGVWQTTDDFSKTQAGVKAGDVKYRDLNGDKVINDADRTIIGKAFPDFIYGATSKMTYKGFSFEVFIEGNQGSSILNQMMVDSYFPVSFRRNKLADVYLNRWTPSNPTNEYPSFVNPTSQGQRTINSKTVEDASYLRIQAIRLSYEVPIPKNKFVRSVNIFVTGQNLKTFTNYKGTDPATNAVGDDILKIDYSTYPLTRTFTGGINVQF